MFKIGDYVICNNEIVIIEEVCFGKSVTYKLSGKYTRFNEAELDEIEITAQGYKKLLEMLEKGIVVKGLCHILSCIELNGDIWESDFLDEHTIITSYQEFRDFCEKWRMKVM